MKLSLTVGALLCTLGIAVITHSRATAPVIDYTTIMNPNPIDEDSINATPVRFVYIQFSGENSQMIQLQDVSGKLSERLSEYSTVVE